MRRTLLCNCLIGRVGGSIGCSEVLINLGTIRSNSAVSWASLVNSSI